MREEQIASSKPLYDWSAVSTCHSHSSWEESSSWVGVTTAGPCTCTCAGGLGPRPHARSPQKQVLPLLLHGQEASTPVVLPPLGTFTHPLQAREPCSSFHNCLFLLSKGHASVATVPQLHELPSALHTPWGLVLLAESTATLAIHWVFPTLGSLFGLALLLWIIFL